VITSIALSITVVHGPLSFLLTPHQGTLQKKGSGPVASWKTRFFVVKERFMWYYKTRKDVFPLDVILLNNFKAAKHQVFCGFILWLCSYSIVYV
jgi:hypothetical protein